MNRSLIFLKNLESELLNQGYVLLNRMLLNMDRLNKVNSGSLPITAYNVTLHSNDHNPPHIHIKEKSTGMELKVNIITGEIFHVENEDVEGLKKLKKRVPLWLNETFCNSQKTNQEVAIDLWNKKIPGHQ